MPDLYSILDIPRDADKATIRRAYRRMAKRAHPDGGGNEKKFALVKLAVDVLSDDARRAKYDTTGDASESTIDNSQSDMLQMITQLLIAAMSQCVNRGLEPVYSNLVSLMLELGDTNMQGIKENRKQLDIALSRLRKLQGRFTRKKKKDQAEPNVLEALVAGQIAGHEAKKLELDKNKTALKASLALIRDYEFTPDKKPEDLKNIGNFFYTIAAG